MCDVLQLCRSTYYYESKPIDNKENKLVATIESIFHKSHQIYGARKIKWELKKVGFTVSRRKISRIMKENGLVSKYTVAQFKPSKNKTNETGQDQNKANQNQNQLSQSQPNQTTSQQQNQTMGQQSNPQSNAQPNSQSIQQANQQPQ